LVARAVLLRDELRRAVPVETPVRVAAPVRGDVADDAAAWRAAGCTEAARFVMDFDFPDRRD
jgi:hypothetical protein